MAQFGSRTSVTSQNLSAVADAQGNLIISPDNSFGASPLGIAARTQALYGIPNANFNLLPNDPLAAIATGNELPYWQISNTGSITATMQYDDTNQTYAIRIDPSAAGSGDSLALTTRSYLLNDSNLSLRQKAFASIAKVGTMATSQWNLVMSATYYDHAGSALSTYAIGTANSGTTWTSINGFTTSGTAVINAAAQYVDVDLTLTATTAVTGTAKVDLNSVLLQTAVAGGGGAQSFLIAEVFTSSTTWVRPTGVEYVSVAVISGGKGGRGGDAGLQGNTSTGNLVGTSGNGGSAGIYAYTPDVYVGDVGSVIVSVGAGGAGGARGSVSKAAGVTTRSYLYNAGTNGAAGGASSFGSYLQASASAVSGSAIPVLGTVIAGPGTQSTGGIGTQSSAGTSYSTSVFLNIPKQPYVVHSTPTAGTYTVTENSGTAVWTYHFATSALPGTPFGQPPGSGFFCSGHSGAGVNITSGTVVAPNSLTTPSSSITSPFGGYAAGLAITTAGSVTSNAFDVTLTAGAGANSGTSNSGCGGGGGAAAMLRTAIGSGGTAGPQGYNASSFTSIAGSGGSGDSGLVVITYVA